MFERERTQFEIIYYAIYLVFQGLSFRGASDAIEPFVKRSHKSVWEWCQDLGSDKKRISRLFRLGRERVNIFAIDETGIKIDGEASSFPVSSLRTVRREDPWVILVSMEP